MTDYSDYYTPKIYIPKLDKERILERAKLHGLSVSSYICMLIEQDIGKLSGKADYGTPGKGRRKANL